MGTYLENPGEVELTQIGPPSILPIPPHQPSPMKNRRKSKKFLTKYKSTKMFKDIVNDMYPTEKVPGHLEDEEEEDVGEVEMYQGWFEEQFFGNSSITNPVDTTSVSPIEVNDTTSSRHNAFSAVSDDVVNGSATKVDIAPTDSATKVDTVPTDSATKVDIAPTDSATKVDIAPTDSATKVDNIPTGSATKVDYSDTDEVLFSDDRGKSSTPTLWSVAPDHDVVVAPPVDVSPDNDEDSDVVTNMVVPPPSIPLLDNGNIEGTGPQSPIIINDDDEDEDEDDDGITGFHGDLSHYNHRYTFTGNQTTSWTPIELRFVLLRILTSKIYERIDTKKKHTSSMFGFLSNPIITKTGKQMRMYLSKIFESKDENGIMQRNDNTVIRFLAKYIHPRYLDNFIKCTINKGYKKLSIPSEETERYDNRLDRKAVEFMVNLKKCRKIISGLFDKNLGMFIIEYESLDTEEESEEKLRKRKKKKRKRSKSSDDDGPPRKKRRKNKKKKKKKKSKKKKSKKINEEDSL
jgi:hypothetical protein